MFRFEDTVNSQVMMDCRRGDEIYRKTCLPSGILFASGYPHHRVYRQPSDCACSQETNDLTMCAHLNAESVCASMDGGMVSEALKNVRYIYFPEVSFGLDDCRRRGRFYWCVEITPTAHRLFGVYAIIGLKRQ